MEFNNRSESFLYSVGSVGDLNFWDIDKKNKIKLNNMKIPISASRISKNGNFIVFALGYDWSLGLYDL